MTVNSQLEKSNRYPMPLPDDLVRKLSGGYGFSKVDLADAYNQCKLGPEVRNDLLLACVAAMSTFLWHQFCSRAFSGNYGKTDSRLSGCHCVPR